MRFSPATASTRRRLALTSGMAPFEARNAAFSRPSTRSFCIWPGPPPYGTWTMSRPARWANIAMNMWCVVPFPAERDLRYGCEMLDRIERQLDERRVVREGVRHKHHVVAVRSRLRHFGRADHRAGSELVHD